MIPLYGFLEGDTMGLLMLAREAESVAQLADRLQKSASLRVATRARVRLLYRGREIDPRMTVLQAGFEPLERFDVVSVPP